jgi:hypothetical protein
MTLSGRTFETSRKIPEDVFTTGKQTMFTDLLEGDLPQLHTGTVALGIRHVLCTPLRFGRYVERAEQKGADEIIGVVYLDGRERAVVGIGDCSPRNAVMPKRCLGRRVEVIAAERGTTTSGLMCAGSCSRPWANTGLTTRRNWLTPDAFPRSENARNSERSPFQLVPSDCVRTDLKFCGVNAPCGFEARPRHFLLTNLTS